MNEQAIAQARALQEQGFSTWEVAERIGYSYRYTKDLLNPGQLERNLRSSLESKRKRFGVCVDCGGLTKYNGHRVNGASWRCASCNGKAVAKARRGKGPRQTELLTLLGKGERRFTEIEDALGITETHTTVLLNHAVRDGLVVRVSRGLYRLPEKR